MRIKVPTGDILIVDTDTGQLECVSLSDYGKNANIKADFLGITRRIDGVPHGDMLPLEKKWVITISTQYGCSMGCTFCDVPKVGLGRNANFWDMALQIQTCLDLHPEVTHSDRLNLHFARMGEPTWNTAVLNVAGAAKFFLESYRDGFKVHPVVSTMLPRSNGILHSYLCEWMRIKNDLYKGEAGLQLSINTTDEQLRNKMFNGSSHSLSDISELMRQVLHVSCGVEGRKIALNIALTDAPVEARVLRKLFNPEYFMVKITPMHKTLACERGGIETRDGYSLYDVYSPVEEDLKNEGFDVLVFIPSKEEDESRITCGNAILSGTKSFDTETTNMDIWSVETSSIDS